MNVNQRRYPNIDEAVAYEIAFAPVICTYGSVAWDETETCVCTTCSKYEQIADFLAPKSACVKLNGAILDIYHYGVSPKIRDELLQRFDIETDDFRPVRNKTGDIVFYQITPTHTMLPLSNVNKFKQLKPCRKCGSIQYREKEFKNKNGFSYKFISQKALNDLHDLNKSFEEFEMHLPFWVVSKGVYEFFAEFYPRLHFRPIFLKND